MKLTLRVLAVALGVLQAYWGRHAMTSDGIAYLDIADAFIRHDWAVAIDALWSPLYPLLLSLAFILFKPSPYSEFALVHVVNLAIYLFSIVCFEFFLRQLIHHHTKVMQEGSEKPTVAIPENAWFMLGYSLFIYSSLFMTNMSDVEPDVLVAALVYLSSGLLLRALDFQSKRRTYVWLGISLGLGYLAKAIMFPVALLFIVTSVILSGDIRRSVPRMALTFATFLLVAAPLVISMSWTLGRFTLGESGRFNYAIHVNGVRVPHWQGEPAENGVPRHPTRKIFDHPAVYEFGTPFQTTYSVGSKTFYWYEGVRLRFNVRQQWKRIVSSLVLYYWFFYNPVNTAFAIGFITLLLMTPSRWATVQRLKKIGALLVVPVAVFIAYGLVHIEGRYLPAFVVMLWLALYSIIRLPDIRESLKLVHALSYSIGIVIAITTLVGADNFRREASKGESALTTNWQVAEGLKQMGLQPGDEVAQVGTSVYSYWARLARVRIVSEAESADEFWSANETVRRQMVDVISQTGAKVLVAESPNNDLSVAGWRKISEGHYALVLGPTKRP